MEQLLERTSNWIQRLCNKDPFHIGSWSLGWEMPLEWGMKKIVVYRILSQHYKKKKNADKAANLRCWELGKRKWPARGPTILLEQTMTFMFRPSHLSTPTLCSKVHAREKNNCSSKWKLACNSVWMFQQSHLSPKYFDPKLNRAVINLSNDATTKLAHCMFIKIPQSCTWSHCTWL